MKKKILKWTVIMATAVGIIMSSAAGSRDIYAMDAIGKYDVNADPYFENDMELYYQYVESHELKDFMDGTKGIFGDTTMDDIYARRVKVADFDGDNRAEVWITGPAAVSNYITGILDVSDGEVKCVFNGWGSESGRYTDPATGKTGIVISEGNSDGENVHLRKCIYDENWNGIILYDVKGNVEDNTVVYTAYTNNEERQLTMKEYEEETYNLYNNCTVTEAVAETTEDMETTHMDKQGILDFLQSLRPTKTTGNEGSIQNTTITGYPEYDEIIRQYYQGMVSNWSMNEFSQKNLCYLAGREMGGADNLGYCLMDIDGDGTDELLIGCTGENAYTGMFFDMYTLVDGQRVLVVSSAERDRYYVCEDYTVANEGSGGASNSIYNYYNLVTGQLTLKEGVFFDAYSHPENPWFYTTTGAMEDYSTPISEEEGQATIGKYTYMNIPYILLKEINFEGHGENGGTGITSSPQNAEQTQQTSPAQQEKNKIEETEQQAAAIKAQIDENTGMSDEEYKQKLNALYELWDKVLNDVWADLKNTLSSEEMDALTQEEIEWINNKENTVNSIRNVSETDALIQAAEITKQRVYVLFDKLG